jgi:DNA primase
MNMGGQLLFPRTGFTTEDLMKVYDQLAPVLLPHLSQRPLTLKRFPNDIHGESFWEKDAPTFTPDFVQRFPVPRKHEEGVINYTNLAHRRSLAWAASVGRIEIHAFLHRYLQEVTAGSDRAVGVRKTTMQHEGMSKPLSQSVVPVLSFSI